MVSSQLSSCSLPCGVGSSRPVVCVAHDHPSIPPAAASSCASTIFVSIRSNAAPHSRAFYIVHQTQKDVLLPQRAQYALRSRRQSQTPPGQAGPFRAQLEACVALETWKVSATMIIHSTTNNGYWSPRGIAWTQYHLYGKTKNSRPMANYSPLSFCRGEVAAG